jgi:tetratricopeptide (TPR) repeat protein
MSGSDRDDKTGIFKQTRTRVFEKRIQVQMPSGKIYGPYTRDEVLGFIESKRIRGEEKILYEGDLLWRPIGTDPEFFDAIQAIISGKKIKRAETKAEEVSGFSNHDEKTRASSRGTQTELLSPSEKLSEKTRITDAKNIDRVDESPRHLPDVPFEVRGTEEKLPLASQNVGTGVPNEALLKKKKASLLGWVLVAALLVVLTYVLMQPSDGPPRPSVSSKGPVSQLRISAAFNYTRSLTDTIRGFSVDQIEIPKELNKVPLRGRFVFSLNTRDAVLRIKQALTDETAPERKTSAFWQQLTMDLHLLGLKIQVVDVSSGRALINKSQELIEKLKSSQFWDEDTARLHELLVAHATGDWNKLIQEADLSSYPIAAWLKADANWWSSWAENKFKKVPAEAVYGLSAELEVISKIRDAFLKEDPQIATWLLQLASIDPESPYLWFVSAQLNWRKSKSVKVDGAYRDFMVGLGALSLYPPAIQLEYWGQFAEFLKSYARSETFAKALTNVELLSRGNIGKASGNKKWWDMQEEGLDAKSIADEILERSSRGILNDRDRAALLVLGQALEGGEDYLFVVGTHFCFEERWSEAEKIFDNVLSRDSKNKDALFGKIWALARQFRFVEAQDVYDRFLRLSRGDLVHLRSRGLIHYLGREFDVAHKIFEDYLKQKPNDAWALYFNAETYFAQKDYVSCVKAANLAKMQGRGELGFRAELLFYQCRVKANLGIKDSLENLARMVRESPDSLPLRILFIQIMNESELRKDALRTLEESLTYFPFSAKLKIAAGKFYEAQGQISRALEYFYQAAQLEPSSGEPWVKMGQVLESQGNYQQAAQNYETAARVQPGYPEIYLFAARAYEKAGNKVEAAVFYEKEISARPEALATFVEAAEFFLRNNTPKKVPEIYRKFQRGFQEDPQALVRLAQAYDAMGDSANAKAFASRAVAGAPENPFVNLTLANILDRAGEYHLAKRYYQIYLEYLPQAPDAEEIRSRLSKAPYSN